MARLDLEIILYIDFDLLVALISHKNKNKNGQALKVHRVVFYHSVQANVNQDIFSYWIVAIESTFSEAYYICIQIFSRY